MSRAVGKKGPLNSQPGTVSPFPLVLNPSNSLWKGCISLILKGYVPHHPWEVLQQDRWLPPLNLGPTGEERLLFRPAVLPPSPVLQSILKLQGQEEARPPGHYQTRLPLLEQAILPLPPATTANRDPLHTRAPAASIVS